MSAAQREATDCEGFWEIIELFLTVLQGPLKTFKNVLWSTNKHESMQTPHYEFTGLMQ